MINYRSIAPFLFLTLLLSIIAPVSVFAKDKINWSITPYLWMVDTKLELKADGAPIGSGRVRFSDLIDSTDAAFQIHVEGGKSEGKWSGFIDLTYLDASDDSTENMFRIRSDSEQWFIDAAISYWPRGEASGFNVFGGIRYTDLDDEYKIIDSTTGGVLGTIRNDRDFTDLLLGGRYRFDLNELWSIHTLGDYAFGDSDGIYQLQALVRYAVGRKKQNGIYVGYRYKEAKLESSNVEEECEFKGPVAAFSFRF